MFRGELCDAAKFGWENRLIFDSSRFYLGRYTGKPSGTVGVVVVDGQSWKNGVGVEGR